MKRLLSIFVLSIAICVLPVSAKAENRMAGGTHISSMGKDIHLNGDNMQTHDILKVQKSLNEKGFYKGLPSGVWDNDTTTAVESFQEAKDLEITGDITAETLKELDVFVGTLNQIKLRRFANPAQNYELNK